MGMAHGTRRQLSLRLRSPQPRCSGSRGFTLTEVLVAVAILILLAAIALPLYLRSVERARSTEALATLGAIRQAELVYQAAHGTFVEATDLSALNATLDLELTARQFDYHVEQTSGQAFVAVATSRRPGSMGPRRITMDHTGRLTYLGPEGGSSAGGSVGGGWGGGGGIGGGSGSGGGGGGGGGSAGPTGGSGSSGGGSPGSGSSGGGDGSSGGGSSGGSGGGETPGVIPGGGLAYRSRGPDLWTGWPDVNTRNITGSVGLTLLAAMFDLVANSGAHAITDDLFRKGVALSFGDPQDFTGPTANAIAFLNVPGGSFLPFPDTPTPPPVIKLNPAFVNEDPIVLAATLVHEGTHFQQYLDGTLIQYATGGITVVDVEFTAWWNQAVYWQGVRPSFSPYDTVVEVTNEAAYQAALQGEGALRNLIASLYT